MRMLTRLREMRATLTLIALSIAAAGLYAWGATGRADLARLTATADGICAAAGSAIEVEGRKRGVDCRAAVARLATAEQQTREQTARILTDAAATRDRKAQDDIAAARRAAEQARIAARNMETAEHAIDQNNNVGGDWFDALNRLGGLRAPGS